MFTPTIPTIKFHHKFEERKTNALVNYLAAVFAPWKTTLHSLSLHHRTRAGASPGGLLGTKIFADFFFQKFSQKFPQN
jgi:hypothetical protein